MKKEIKKPTFPKCKKPMQLVATGLAATGNVAWTFWCAECKKAQIVIREEQK